MSRILVGLIEPLPCEGHLGIGLFGEPGRLDNKQVGLKPTDFRGVVDIGIEIGRVQERAEFGHAITRRTVAPGGRFISVCFGP